MSETHRIVALSHRAATRGDLLCLATVVHVEGSAYRKPGARMLLTSSGERAGTISGGCLESEVSRKAWWLTANGPRVERYSSFADEDGGMPYGLGCGGTVTLLLEQGAPAQAVLSALDQTLSARAPAVIISALGHPPRALEDDAPSRQTAPATPPGTVAVLRLSHAAPSLHAAHTLSPQIVYLRPDPAPSPTSTPTVTLHPSLASAAQAAFTQQSSSLLTADYAAFNEQSPDAPLPAYVVEYLAPPPAITVFGAGDDVQPIAALAHALGWRVTVADGRAHLARRERFPEAAQVRVLTYPDPTLRAACDIAVSPLQRSFRQRSSDQEQSAAAATLLFEPEPTALLSDEVAVIMTHSYEQDRAILAALLPRELRYLGILGPRHRTERLLSEICPGLGLSIEQAFACLHSPIGLDLGARDPATVALSIVAQIQATLEGRSLTRIPVEHPRARKPSSSLEVPTRPPHA